MPQSKTRHRVRDDFLSPEEGKSGYAAVEKALELRGGPKKAKIGDTEKTFRKYHLTAHKVEVVLACWLSTKQFQSPYCKSITTDFLSALAVMGLNKVHHTGRVMGVMRKIMSAPKRIRGDGRTDWEAFDKKPKRTERGKTPPGRMETMARNLRKTRASGSPYPDGRKLEQIGCCVDIFVRQWEERQPMDDPAKAGQTQIVKCREVFYRLNTHTTMAKIFPVEFMEDIDDHPVDLTKATMGPV